MIKMEPLDILFKSTTADGKLNNLDELTPLAKKFLVCVNHLQVTQKDLRVEEADGKVTSQINEKIKTWNFINEKTNFKICKSTVLKYLGEWISTLSDKTNIQNTNNAIQSTPKRARKSLITEEFENYVRNQCGEHTTTEMASILKIPRTTLHDWAQRNGLLPYSVLQYQDVECYFCPLKQGKANVFSPAISIANQKLVKNQCGDHSCRSMAEMLKLPYSTLTRWVREGKIIFSKKEGYCHFCNLQENNNESKEEILLDQMPSTPRSANVLTPLKTPLPKKQKGLFNTPTSNKILSPSTPSTKEQRNPAKTLFPANLTSTPSPTVKGQTPLFDASYTTKYRRTQSDLDQIKASAVKEETSVLKYICFIASRFCNSKEGGYDQRRAQIFQALAHGETDCESKFKSRVTNEVMTHIKYNAKLSKVDYDLMRYKLEPFLTLPDYRTIYEYEKSLYPKIKPYIDTTNGKVIGAHIPLIDVAKDTVLDILEHHYGKNSGKDPLDVPNKVTMRGGVGGGKTYH